MSTITKELAKLFRKITNSEIDAEGNAHVVLFPADSLLINNARIALASLEAEPVCVIDQSNLDYLKSGSDADVWPASRTEMGDVLLYRAAPPAPVSVPDEDLLHMAASAIEDLLSNKDRYCAGVWADIPAKLRRAAMLQGAAGNSPAIPDRWIPVSERMPEKGQKVFYYFDIVGVHAGYYDGDNTFVNENGGGWLTGDVTHWMEWNMPAAPNREVK